MLSASASLRDALFDVAAGDVEQKIKEKKAVGAETYRADEKPLRRVPIVVTGNDLSTLYAPLLRDGRMDKFLWAPNAEELVEVVASMFSDFDDFARRDAEQLVAAFPKQRSLDFFGAVHARTVDDVVLQRTRDGTDDRRDRRGVPGKALDAARLGVGVDAARKPDWSRVYGARAGRGADGVRELIEIGDALVREQEHVMRTRLVEQYMPGVKQFGGAASELRAAEARRSAERRARASDERRRAAASAARDVSEETRAVAASARAALARASAADPREALRLESPAERAARANRRLLDVGLALIALYEYIPANQRLGNEEIGGRRPFKIPSDTVCESQR